MRAVLSLPFPTPLGGALMLLYYRGRKTGTDYRQPISYVRADDGTLLTPGGGRWTLSLGGGDPVRLRVKGRVMSVRPELVTDPGEVQRLFGVIATKNPRAVRYIPIPRLPDGSLEPGALQAAIDHGFCIVRWHPEVGS
jgi:hypothetical protein